MGFGGALRVCFGRVWVLRSAYSGDDNILPKIQYATRSVPLLMGGFRFDPSSPLFPRLEDGDGGRGKSPIRGTNPLTRHFRV